MYINAVRSFRIECSHFSFIVPGVHKFPYMLFQYLCIRFHFCACCQKLIPHPRVHKSGSIVTPFSNSKIIIDRDPIFPNSFHFSQWQTCMYFSMKVPSSNPVRSCKSVRTIQHTPTMMPACHVASLVICLMFI